MCCFYKSLKIAIDVIDAASDFLAKTKRIIVLPVIFFVVNVVAVLVWIAAFTSVTTLKFDSVAPRSGAVIHQAKQTTNSSDEMILKKVAGF